MMKWRGSSRELEHEEKESTQKLPQWVSYTHFSVCQTVKIQTPYLNVLSFEGETGRPIRSPLREKNVAFNDTPLSRGRSPIKTTYNSPSKSAFSTSPGKVRSPIRTNTFTVQKSNGETPSSVSSYSRVFEDKDGKSKSEETFNREAVEKKTTIIDGEPENGSYTKTTITEREETIEKREVLQFTEVGGTSCPRSPSKILEEYRAKREKEMEKVPSTTTSKTISKIFSADK